MNLRKTFGKYYVGKDLFIQRKAEYGLAFVAILFTITLFLSVIKAFVIEMTGTEWIITTANLLVFVAVFHLIYFGKIHFGVTLLSILGVARLFMLLALYDEMNFYIFLPLMLIAIAVMKTKKFQYYFINISVFALSLGKVVQTIMDFQKDSVVTHEHVMIAFVSFFYIIAIMYIMYRFGNVVENEIIKSKQLMTLSTKDHLTNTFNRRKLDRDVGELALSESISVIIFDYDNFKQINDEHGHPVGDMVLVKTIQNIKQFIRTSDYIIRWGGEEFIIMLHDCKIEVAFTIAEKIRKSIEEFRLESLQELTITLSLGVAEKKDDESIYDTIHRADKALYEAKNSGKNKVAVD